MSEQLDRLFEAHVQHELSSWRGDALPHTLEACVHGLFGWFADVELNDVLTRAQVEAVIDRYVIELRVSGGITELAGEISRLVFTSHSTERARLDQLLTPDMYREFADKILALEAVRRELIALIAQSATARSISAALILHAVLELLAAAIPLPSGLAPPRLASLSARAAAAILPRLEQLVEKALEQHRERIARSRSDQTRELLDTERLRAISDEVWDRVSSLRLSEVFAFIEEQDIEDFVVLVYEFWLRYRKTDFFRRISSEAIDHFFDKYGRVSIAELVDDMGVTEHMVSVEALATFAPMIEHAACSGALERAIRRRLESFYHSAAAREALGK